MKSKKILKTKPWMGCLGLLGLVGLLYFYTHEPVVLVFFVFFSFFSFFWDSKFEQEMSDERLIANQLKARNIAFRTLTVLCILSVVFISNWVGKFNPDIAYPCLIAAISIALAVSSNMSSYLAYKYDKEDE